MSPHNTVALVRSGPAIGSGFRFINSAHIWIYADGLAATIAQDESTRKSSWKDHTPVLESQSWHSHVAEQEFAKARVTRISIGRKGFGFFVKNVIEQKPKGKSV